MADLMDDAGQGEANTADPAAAPVATDPAAAPADGTTAAAAPAEGDKPAAAPAAPTAPESYEDFTLPEGATLSAEAATEIKGLAKELGLSQEQAQKLAEREASQAGKLATSTAAQVQEAQTAWETASRSDKEFGGANLDKNLALAKQARDAFATPELVTMLNETKFGNHPEVVRLFVRVGKAISEDTIVKGGTARERDTSDEGRARRLYGNATA